MRSPIVGAFWAVLILGAAVALGLGVTALVR